VVGTEHADDGDDDEAKAGFNHGNGYSQDDAVTESWEGEWQGVCHYDEDDDVVAVGAYGHQQCSPDTYLMLHAGGMSEVRWGNNHHEHFNVTFLTVDYLLS
jgi:hypothetical protein